MKGIVKLGKKSNPVTLGVDQLKELSFVILEWQKVCEQEKTNRIKINAARDVAIEKIRSNKDLMLCYFDHTFNERASTLQSLFHVLDNGLAKNQLEVVDKSLGAILGVMQNSPLGELRKFEEKLLKENYTIDL